MVYLLVPAYPGFPGKKAVKQCSSSSMLGLYQTINIMLVGIFCQLLQESSVVTRLLAVLVSFMVDDQLSSLAAGKEDPANKVIQPRFI